MRINGAIFDQVLNNYWLADLPKYLPLYQQYSNKFWNEFDSENFKTEETFVLYYATTCNVGN